MSEDIRVCVWNEFRHEKNIDEVRRLYPEGIHSVLAAHLNKQEGITAKTATLDEPEHGLTEALLEWTDVLIWWGHMHHHEVSDVIVERVHRRILDGMGFIPLHSSHYSRIFQKLMGTTCSLKWRAVGERERLWVVEQGHPIVEGIGESIVLKQTEMYGERFDIPQPDQVIFISWFQGGEVFRSGCVFYRGCGKIFYFRPGHESYPIFHNKEILRVIVNTVRWASNVRGTKPAFGKIDPPLEKIQ